MTRVVVTGMGCVTPIGCSVPEFQSNLFAGRIGVGKLTLFNAERFPVKIAAEVSDWDHRLMGNAARPWQKSPRQTQFAITAGLEAAEMAGIPSFQVDPCEFGVYLGCGEPFADFQRFTSLIHESSRSGDWNPDEFAEGAPRIFDLESEREYEPDLAAIHLAELLQAEGTIANCISACVSSTQAIGEAARMIRHGEANLMLCGGAHSLIHPFGVTGFERLSALSRHNDDPQSAVRPFDAHRDGFVIGEGAAMFLIEELDHAKSRGADILGEITGYGSSQDAFRVTDTHPEGRGAAAAIKKALASAGLNPEDIHYINAHGTGTVLNDKVETIAIKQAFGPQAYKIPVSSTKSMLGHATTACGAIELAACLLSLKTGVIPPTMNHDTPDPDCDLDYVPKNAREVACRHVLSNNVGFGGQNAALIVSRFDERTRDTVALSHAA